MRALVLVCLVLAETAQGQEPKVRIATFVADVTPPIGHPCMGGIRGEKHAAFALIDLWHDDLEATHFV